eukprot:4182250-Amphidinium_carterae.1
MCCWSNPWPAAQHAHTIGLGSFYLNFVHAAPVTHHTQTQVADMDHPGFYMFMMRKLIRESTLLQQMLICPKSYSIYDVETKAIRIKSRS